MKHRDNPNQEAIDQGMSLVRRTEKYLIQWAEQIREGNKQNKNYYESALYHFCHSQPNIWRLEILNDLITKYETETRNRAVLIESYERREVCSS